MISHLLRLLLWIGIILLKTTHTHQNKHASHCITWDTTLNLVAGNSRNLTFHAKTSVQLPVHLHLNVTNLHSSTCGNGSAILISNEVLINSQQTFVCAKGISLGEVAIEVSIHGNISCEIDDSVIHVYVEKSHALAVLIQITGWLGLISWAIASYPQIIMHFKRKSVVGFSFDYLTLNTIGYVCYCIYNISMMWIPQIKDIYKEKYKNEVNPVHLTDVIMTMNGLLVLTILSVQCIIYEKLNQRVSTTVRVIGSVIFVALFILLIITAASDKIDWLQFITYLSLVKLGITVIKYTPQIFLNFKLKSTFGFSIQGVLLDFSGGVFSLLQLLLEAGNNNEWAIILGDPTKFGLGLLTLCYDIILMIQHFILYAPRARLENNFTEDAEESTPLLKSTNNEINT